MVAVSERQGRGQGQGERRWQRKKAGGRGSNQDGADKAGREWLGSQFDGFRGMFLGSVT